MLWGLGAGVLLAASRPVIAAAPSIAVTGQPSPDRRLHLHNVNTTETLDVVYFRDGRLDPEALRALDRFLRDHRTGKVARMDPRLYDFLHDLQECVACTGDAPTKIVSAYRAPETNRAKRGRGRGVARNSYHVQAMAFDVVLPGIDVRAAKRAATGLQRGGVGVYPRSGFLHLDVGPPRTW
ncbi:MAG: DUF882 domain-containing protein [Alphaproteobacteria bacterium]